MADALYEGVVLAYDLGHAVHGWLERHPAAGPFLLLAAALCEWRPL